MAYTSGFFDAIDQGGGNYDRVYRASSFAHYFSLLVRNGVFPDPSTGMQVKASPNPDMSVSIQPGSGWVNGYYITVDSNKPEKLTIPTANPSLSRIDSVIMGLNYVDREIQLYIKSGAVSASPSAVSLQRDNDLYELELAQITVGAGVVSIPQANITDMRQNTSRCGIVAGTIDQIDTTDLFAQYNDAFQTWFDNIKSQLSGDVAANLQNQINDKAPKNHKSTTTEYGGASSTEYGHVKLTDTVTAEQVDSSKGIAVTPKYALTLAGKYAPKNHATTGSFYGLGDNSRYGHVKLSKSINSSLGLSDGTAATPSAVKEAYDLANMAIKMLGERRIQCGWAGVDFKSTSQTDTRIDFPEPFNDSSPVVIIGQPFNGVVCTVFNDAVDDYGFTVNVPAVGSATLSTRALAWIAIGKA